MGRRAAELAGVLIASLITSFVTGLALSGPNEPVLYVVGALVPLALLLVYWLWLEPRADADRLRARRLQQAVEDAFELTQSQVDPSAPPDVARRAFYDRLDIPDLFEPDHIEASSVLGDAFDAGKALLARMDAESDPSSALITEIGAWENRTGDQIEVTRGSGDALSFRHPSGMAASEPRKRLESQVLLLEIWVGDERKRAGDRAKDRYRSRHGGEPMQTIGIVLNVGADQAEEFENGFREQEAPIWNDLHARGLLVMATLTKLDITTVGVDGATQYLVVAIFATDEGHHAHDDDPRFEAWNKRADTFQIAKPFVFGGDTIVSAGP